MDVVVDFINNTPNHECFNMDVQALDSLSVQSCQVIITSEEFA